MNRNDSNEASSEVTDLMAAFAAAEAREDAAAMAAIEEKLNRLDAGLPAEKLATGSGNAPVIDSDLPW